LELIVATFLVGLISLAAFKILLGGTQYLKLNQLAIDAQRSGLALLSEVGSGIQSTRRGLITRGPNGVVFASPFKEDGSVEFDPVDSELKWQKWICFYLDGEEVTRRERTLLLPSSKPGPAPAPSSFAATEVSKVMGREVTAFSVTQISATLALWSIDLTVGSMTDATRYGIELHSEVGPRN